MWHQIQKTFFRLAYPLARTYWKIRKPRTFGVKAIITDENKTHILLVKHSYGKREIWTIPGGGYNPKKETPILAVQREIQEELNLCLDGYKKIGESRSKGEGKRDTATIFHIIIYADQVNNIQLSAELDATWWAPISTMKNGRKETAKVVDYALKLLEKN